MTSRLQAYREHATREYHEERERRQVAFGECFCGCKKKTTIAIHTNRPCGWVSGLPKRYIRGHSPIEHAIVSTAIQYTESGVPYRLISLTQNQVAKVSPHRYEELASFIWSANWVKNIKNYYAIRTEHNRGKSRVVYMHRQILGLNHGDSRQVDHKERTQTLDNTDENLRFATPREQQQNKGRCRSNKSGYKGVQLNPKNGKWIATIKVNGKAVHLGTYDTPEFAYEAYCIAAVKFHGEFACLN